MQLFILVAIVAVFGLFISVIIGVVISAQKKRQAQIEGIFREMGFELARKPEGLMREQAWQPFSACKSLRSGAKGVRWHARGCIDGCEVVAIEHQYVINTGQSAQRVVHVCVACRCPDSWPMVELRGEHVLHRIADKLGMKDIELESEAFNRRWRVHSESEEQAILVLTPAVQAMLESAPGGECWMIGRGWVRLLGRGRATKPEAIRDALSKPVRVLEQVPPELFEEVGQRV